MRRLLHTGLAAFSVGGQYQEGGSSSSRSTRFIPPREKQKPESDGKDPTGAQQQSSGAEDGRRKTSAAEEGSRSTDVKNQHLNAAADAEDKRVLKDSIKQDQEPPLPKDPGKPGNFRKPDPDSDIRDRKLLHAKRRRTADEQSYRPEGALPGVEDSNVDRYQDALPPSPEDYVDAEEASPLSSDEMLDPGADYWAEQDRISGTLPHTKKFNHVANPEIHISGDLDSFSHGQRIGMARMLAQRAADEQRVTVQGEPVELFLGVGQYKDLDLSKSSRCASEDEHCEANKQAASTAPSAMSQVAGAAAAISASADSEEVDDPVEPQRQLRDYHPAFQQELQREYEKKKRADHDQLLGGQSAAKQTSEKAEAAASPRQLAAQPSGSTWDWINLQGNVPTTTTINGPDIVGTPTLKDVPIIGYASTNLWLQNEIIVNLQQPNRFGSGAHPDPKMKFVDGEISAREQCQDFQGRDVRMGVTDFAGTVSFGISGQYANHTKLFDADLNVNNPELLQGSNQNFAFMHGGNYKVCYAPDGDFVSTSPRTTALITSLWLPSPMLVYGVRSDCLNSPTCIKDEQWHCWYPGLSDQAADCNFAFTGQKFRVGFSLFASTVSKMTWTGLYSGEQYDNNGTITTPATPTECRASEPVSTIWQPYPSTFVEMTGVKIATMPKVAHDQTGTFTMRVCYCGDYAESGNKCDGRAEFIQAFGRLYFWRMNVCDYENALSSTCITNPYIRVIPHQKFVIQITCPMGGACKPDDNNRIGILATQDFNDFPSWDPSAGCMGTAIDDKFVHWPNRATQMRKLGGGARMDYKVWRDVQPRLDFAPGEKKDICYCQNDCSQQANMNWFKIGHVIGANFALGSAEGADGTALAANHLLRYTGKPGAVVFYGGTTTPFYMPANPTTNAQKELWKNDYPAYGDGQRYSGTAKAKIFPYDFGQVPGTSPAKTVEQYYGYDTVHVEQKNRQEQMDIYCNNENNVPVTLDTTLADQLPQASDNIAGDANAVSRYHAFTNGGTQRTTMKKPGIVGICYCSILAANGSCDKGNDVNWRFATLLMISGPLPNQVWSLPIDAVSRIILQGSGFDEGDVLRIVPNNVQCTDNSNNPAPDTSYKIGCPSVEGTGCITTNGCPATSGITCRSASATDGQYGSFIYLQTLGKNQITPPIGIESVATQFSTKDYTVLKFTGNIQFSGLKEGDTLLIDKNDLIINDKDAAAQDISLWKLNSRMREVANVFTNNFQPEDVPDPTISDKRTNPIGWKVKFYGANDVRIPDVDKAKYLSIPLRWNEFMGSVTVAGQIYWYQYPYTISFKDNSGRWLRSSATQSNAEIKGKTVTNTAAPLRVCWGRLEGSQPKFYADAGQLTFFQAPAMAKAHVSLTSTKQQGYAPIIISFETSSTATTYKQYSIGYQHQITLRFKDLEKIDPRKNTDHSPVVVPQPMDSGEVQELDAFQDICGMLFVEMWSNDREGFPMPKGCYYSRKYRDASEGNAINLQWREISIVFPFSNGLKHICQSHANQAIACRYQLVLNAYIGAQSILVANDNLVDVYTKCPRCGANGRDVMFERGITTLNADSPTGGSLAPGDNTSPNLEQFIVPNPATSAVKDATWDVFDLTSNTVVDAQLVAGDGLQSISAGNYLRLYLFPLLMWEVPTAACSVLCVDYTVANTVYKCGTTDQVNPTLEVAIASLTPFARRNYLKIRMPETMTDVVSTTIKHGIQISSLDFPPGGFFNVRMGVQLTDSADLKPVYKPSTGLMYKATGTGGHTTGRIVINGATGYGIAPFHSDIRNELYVRLQLGATLFHNGQTDAAYLEIKAPSGTNKKYQGRCEQTAPAPSNIPNFFDFDRDGYIDYNHGTLGTSTNEGKWGFGEALNFCKYTLYPNQAIYAGMSIYVKLIMDNPTEAMTKHDVDNVWGIRMVSRGVAGTPSTARPMGNPNIYPFNPAYTNNVLTAEATYQRPNEPKLWYQNVGVVSPLEQPVLSPTHFRLSTSLRPEYSDVYIFFKIVTVVGRNGFIKVDAPCGFDFGNQVIGKPTNCVTGGLPRYYYDYIDSNYDSTTNFTNVLSCTAQNLIPQCPAPGPYNRAVLNIGDSMGQNADTGRMAQYGFKLRVLHSLELRYPADFTMWQLFVSDHADFVVDGTRDTLFFQKISKEGNTDARVDKAFGLYVTDFTKVPTIAVTVENLTPATLKPQGDKGTYVTLNGLRLMYDVYGVGFRFISPLGFRWTTEPGPVFFNRPRGSSVVGTQNIWPCENLQILMFTQVTWQNCQFNGMTTYGFSMEATVPDLSPVYSSNSFYIELGYLGTQVTNSSANDTYRYNAMPYDAPLVRALRNTRFHYRTARANSDNVITIEFRLITPLVANEEALVIEGKGKNALFDFKCDRREHDNTGVAYTIIEQKIFPHAPPDFTNFPHGYGCKDDRTGFLYLYVNTTAAPQGMSPNFESGYYKMDLMITNVPPNESPDTWSFGTFKNGLPQEVQGGPVITPETIDAAAVAPGFSIYDEMTKGLLVKFADAELEADVREGTGRDDRPGYVPDAPQKNQLIFRFQMKNAPNVKIDGGFVLKGPDGFVFANDCTDKIIVDKNRVFGEHSGLGLVCQPDYLTNCAPMVPCAASLNNPRCRAAKMNANQIYGGYAITEWPAGKEPEVCNGFGNVARMTIPVGLDDSLDYVFRIEIESNPPKTPNPNFWSIEYSGESSTLFESFVLQTVTGLTVSQVSRAVRSANLAESFKNPVEFTFQPFQTVPKRDENDPYGGTITVEAPTGYDFVSETASRRVLRDGTPVSKYDKKRLLSTIKKLRERRRLTRRRERARMLAQVTEVESEDNENQGLAQDLAAWERKEIYAKGRAPPLPMYTDNGKILPNLIADLYKRQPPAAHLTLPRRALQDKKKSATSTRVVQKGPYWYSEDTFDEEDRQLLDDELAREAAFYKQLYNIDFPKTHKEMQNSGLMTTRMINTAEEAQEQMFPLRRLVTNRCNLSLKTVDRTTIMVPGVDVDCEILANGKLQARVLSVEKELTPAKVWELIVYVYNRANIVTPDTGTGDFEIRTFDKTMTLLDLARIPGFDVINIINLWQVHNKAGVYNGMESVPGVEFVVSLPDALNPADRIEIHAPLGFTLRDQGGSNACNNFQWASGPPGPFPTSVSELCGCNFELNGKERCGLEFDFRSVAAGTPLPPANFELRFSVDTSNPEQVDSEIGNHWVVFHKRGTETGNIGGVPTFSYTTRSTHAYKSWVVRPQLQNVVIDIVGSRKAAESYTNITIAFVPVQNAVTMLAEVVSPPGFKFDTCAVKQPQVKDPVATAGNILVVNSMGVQAGVANKAVLITSVRLGELGGQTRWNIRTYINELVNGLPQVPQDLMDERLNVPGFIMPGKLQVLENPPKRLESDYYSSSSVYPTMSQFPARESELNTAEISFRTTQTVYAGGYIYITCQGPQAYTLDREAFSISGGSNIIDVNDQIVILNPATGGLEVQLHASKPPAEAVINANEIYKVRFRVTPKKGQSNWKIETFALNNFALPSNTNDGEEGPFDPVFRIGVTILVVNDRRPPLAVITLKVRVVSGNASVKQVVLIAPPTFDFPQDCGTNCEPYVVYQCGPGCPGRKSVRIFSPDPNLDLTLATLNEMQIKTITPAVTPAASSWFVQTMSGSLSGGFRVTGWERYSGFNIRQMTPIKLWYPQRRGLQGANFAFTFYVAVNGGRIINVVPPVLYEVYCSTMPSTGAPAFFQVSLPGGKPGCVDSPLALTLTEALKGETTYSFIIGGDVPTQDAQSGVTQEFALVVRAADGEVLDGSSKIPIRLPLTLTMASRATLNWPGAPVEGTRQLVHIGLDFDFDLPMEAILVTLPPGITPDFSKELVERKRDVKNLNKLFPVATADQWIEFSARNEYPAFVKILTDEAAGLVIAQGRYKFEFYVQLPVGDLPSENIWYVSLCAARQCRSIRDEPASAIPLTFPIPGFNFGESSDKVLYPSSSRQKAVLGLLPAWALVFALVFTQLFAGVIAEGGFFRRD
ncbi:unnamed protein product [Amoebophrya sp. A120]|nr:unnamed protein product [Amoebophrya sp. A120]|eukprot:GSA120T00002973001.1